MRAPYQILTILYKRENNRILYSIFYRNSHPIWQFISGGGEPLTRPDLLDILEYGKNKQLAVSVVSNGLLLTKEYIEQLNTKNLDTFWISLDGLERNHELLIGKGTYYFFYPFTNIIAILYLFNKWSNLF